MVAACQQRCSCFLLAVVAATVGAVSGPSRYACAVTPNSPEVKDAVRRATEYLKTANPGRVGGEALLGLALLKSDVPAEHPRIVQAVNAVRQEASKSTYEFGEIYTPSVFITFFIELDPEKYAPEINKLIGYLESRARPYGGWGYPAGDNSRTADTSMTQYALLALWEADQSGFAVSSKVVENAVTWLSKTQDPSGGFGYQGTISTGAGLVPQTGVSVSLTTAGLCATLMAEDILGLLRDPAEKEDDLPEGLTRVSDKKGKPTSLARNLFSGIQGRSNAWLEKNREFDIGYYRFYFAYIYERYWALRELAGDRASNDWFDWLARNLLNTQRPDGSWEGHHGAAIETSFCVLSLVRSMKKSIEKDRTYGNGNLVGGRGLPKDSQFVQVRGGRVVSKEEVTALEKLLQKAGEADDEEYTKAWGELAELSPDEARPLVSQQAARLRELAGGASADKRLIAVQSLARAGTLDDVPTLIYALTDPESEIVLAARDGLRRLSRRIHGFGMPDDFDEKDRRIAIDKWKAWYLAIRPDAEFEN